MVLRVFLVLEFHSITENHRLSELGRPLKSFLNLPFRGEDTEAKVFTDLLRLSQSVMELR